jgi:hypothetical protein
VAQAPEWLKINHADYTELEIFYDELKLNRYPKDSPPVSVEYHQAKTNKVEEGTSVFDSSIDAGISDGDCPFVVHGLMEDQMTTKSAETLKAIALKH